jgi:general secretion pathway protein L
MSIIGEIGAAFSLWIDAVARALSAPVAHLKPVRRIEVVEDDEGRLTMRLATKAGGGTGDLPPSRIELADGALTDPLSPQWAAAVRGGIVELVLRPSRFVFRPLELPSRAAEFLDGIVRAQIDRLTPWNAAEAIFHWTPPAAIGSDRIAMTVVATGRAAVTSLAQAFSGLGAFGIEISTRTSADGRITVFSQRPGGEAGFSRTRLVLVGIFATTGILAVLSSAIGGYVVDSYDAQHQQIERRIAERRAIMRGSQNGAGSSPLELLIRRKQTTPSSVIVVEALSALLPEHTYATEIRIQGDKLQIVGITRDAPSLIQILEQSPHVASAGFYAPTTRAASEPGERFHIEARLRPHFGSGT